MYCIKLFSSPSSPSCCWNVVGWVGGCGGRETEAHNRNRPTSAFSTAYRSGSGGWGVGGVGGGGAEFSGQRSEPKLNQKINKK